MPARVWASFASFLLLGLLTPLAATEITPARLASVVAPTSMSAGGASSVPVFSGNGRCVVFLSDANNLVTNDDRAPYLDVFAHNLDTGITTLVSVNRSGMGGGDGISTQPCVSSNGHVVAFVSLADNLAPNSPTNVAEVYLRDLVSGTMILARTNELTGSAAGPRGSGFPLLSADGSRVIFQASNGNFPSTADVFLRDLQSGAFTLISVSSNGGSANSISQPASVSGNAGKVAFLSYSTNIALNAGGRNRELFVRDFEQQTTIWASSAMSNVFAGVTYFCDEAVLSESGGHVIFVASTGFSQVFLFRLDLSSGDLAQIAVRDWGSPWAGAWPSLSPDGRYAVYSDGTNVWLWDGTTGSNTLVSVNSGGTAAGNGLSYSPDLSRDATRVAFLSDSTDLTAEETHGQAQVFARDLIAGVTRLVSLNLDGAGVATGDLRGALPTISPDGALVAFDTSDANLVAGDRNQASDVFVRSLNDGTTELISKSGTNLASLTSVGDSTVLRNCMSADGRFIVFKSLDHDLVDGDSNGTPDLFIRDLTTGSNGLVSANAAELGGTNITVPGSEISSDGRYAAFSHRYWPAGAPGPAEEVFRRDLLNGTLTLVSASTNGTRSGGATAPSMSADGRWIAFQSAAAGLFTNAYGTGSNIFLRDLVSNQTLLVSISTSGAPANGDSWGPRVSPDGRWVVFLSRNPSLVSPSGLSLFALVYVREVASNRTYLASLGSSGTVMLGNTREMGLSGNGRYVLSRFTPLSSSTDNCYLYDLATHSNLLVCSDCRAPSIARDGRWLAYERPSSRTATRQIERMDLLTGATNIASVNNAGEMGNATSSTPVVSPDGRYVTFLSLAGNLAAPGGIGLPNLFCRDLLQRKTLLLTPSLNSSVPGNGTAGPPILAPDGQTIIFHSYARDLVEQDFNNDRDVFLLRISRGDSDADGMDDDWEIAYFGNLSRDGTGDFDHDGQSDIAEFVAGTDPTDGNSIFRALTVEAPGSSLARILWSAVSGKTYQVQYKTNLSSAAWIDLSGPLLATGSTGVANDGQAGQSVRRFYRVLLVQ